MVNMSNMAHAAQRLVRVPVIYHEGNGRNGYVPTLAQQPPPHSAPMPFYYRSTVSPPRSSVSQLV